MCVSPEERLSRTNALWEVSSGRKGSGHTGTQDWLTEGGRALWSCACLHKGAFRLDRALTDQHWVQRASLGQQAMDSAPHKVDTGQQMSVGQGVSCKCLLSGTWKHEQSRHS